jgi:hypothetical protein
MATIRNNGSKKNGKKKTVTEDILDALRPDNMISNAQKVLSSAVNILEEEIAAGIVAAKRIEKKVIDVEDIRNNPEDLMNRIRKDTHEAVDIFLDALVAISRQLNAITNIIPKTEKGKEKDAVKKKAAAITVIENEKPVKPGETAVLYLTLNNDDPDLVVKIIFPKTDLSAGIRQSIPAANMQLNPTEVSLLPGETKQLSIQIKVPKNCKAGTYSALLIDKNDTSNRVVISLVVV